MTAGRVARISGRVIVVDDRERVLLLGMLNPENGGPRRQWITPGGRAHSGEDPRDAAVRELKEETGLVVSGSQLGSQVAYFEGLWDAPDGVHYRVRDNFWLLRTPAFTLDTSGMDPGERVVLKDDHWWSISDLRNAPAGELILPIGLGDLTASLLAHGNPDVPSRLPKSSS